MIKSLNGEQLSKKFIRKHGLNQTITTLRFRSSFCQKKNSSSVLFDDGARNAQTQLMFFIKLPKFTDYENMRILFLLPENSGLEKKIV